MINIVFYVAVAVVVITTISADIWYCLRIRKMARDVLEATREFAESQIVINDIVAEKIAMLESEDDLK